MILKIHNYYDDNLPSFVGLGIGFTQMQHPIREDVSSFKLCTQIDSGTIDPDLMDISLDIILTGGTADGKYCACY